LKVTASASKAALLVDSSTSPGDFRNQQLQHQRIPSPSLKLRRPEIKPTNTTDHGTNRTATILSLSTAFMTSRLSPSSIKPAHIRHLHD
jgi:hypothetical protein